MAVTWKQVLYTDSDGSGLSGISVSGHTHSYLPLSGGTLSGGLTTGGDFHVPSTSNIGWGDGTNRLYGHEASNYVKIDTDGKEAVRFDASQNAKFYGQAIFHGNLSGGMPDGRVAKIEVNNANKAYLGIRQADQIYWHIGLEASDTTLHFRSGNVGSDHDELTLDILGNGVFTGSVSSGADSILSGNSTISQLYCFSSGTYANRMGWKVNQPKATCHISEIPNSSAPCHPYITLALEDSGMTGMQFISGDTNATPIMFGNQSAYNRGVIDYNHDTDKMCFWTNGEQLALTLDSSQKVYTSKGLGVGIEPYGTSQFIVALDFEYPVHIGRADEGNCGLSINAGEVAGRYQWIAFNNDGGPSGGSGESGAHMTSAIKSTVINADNTETLKGKLEFKTNAGDSILTALEINENQNSAFFGKVGVGRTTTYANLHVEQGAVRQLLVVKGGQNEIASFTESEGAIDTNHDTYILVGGYWKASNDSMNISPLQLGYRNESTRLGYIKLNGGTDAMRIYSSGDVTFGGRINVDSGMSIQDGGTTCGGIYTEETVLGSGSSRDICLFAEATGGDVHIMTGGSGTKVLTLDSSNNATFSNKVTAGSLTVSGQVYMSNVDSPEGTGIAINSDYQNSHYVSINGVSFTGGGNISGASFAGATYNGKVTITSSTENTLLVINPTDDNWGGIQFQYDGASKGFACFNSGNMYFGGESGTGTIIQSNGATAIDIDHVSPYDCQFSGDVNVSGDLNISGFAELGGGFNSDGNSTITGDLGMQGDLQLTGALKVVTNTAMNSIFRTAQATASQRAGGGFYAVGHATATSRKSTIWLDPDGGDFGTSGEGYAYFVIEKEGAGGNTAIGNQDTSDLTFFTNGSTNTRLTISSGGNATFAGQIIASTKVSIGHSGTGGPALGITGHLGVSGGVRIGSNSATNSGGGELQLLVGSGDGDFRVNQWNGSAWVDALYITGSTSNATFAGDVTSSGHIRAKSDGNSLSVGASNDLFFTHSGSHSYIENSTGELRIVQTSGDHFSIWTDPTGSGADTKRFNIAPTGEATFYGTPLVIKDEDSVGDSNYIDFHDIDGKAFSIRKFNDNDNGNTTDQSDMGIQWADGGVGLRFINDASHTMTLGFQGGGSAHQNIEFSSQLTGNIYIKYWGDNYEERGGISILASGEQLHLYGNRTSNSTWLTVSTTGNATFANNLYTNGNNMTMNGITQSSRTQFELRNYQGGTRITFGAGSGGYLDDRARIDGDYGSGGDGGNLTFSVREIASSGGDLNAVLTLDRDKNATFAGLVTSPTLTTTGQVYMSNIDAVEQTHLTLGSDYQASYSVKINGVDFTGSGNISAGKIGVGTSPDHILEVETGDQWYGDFNTTADNGAYLTFQIDGTDKGYFGSRRHLQANTSGFENDFMLRAQGHLVCQAGSSKDFIVNTSGSTLALTINSSQDAIFKGDVRCGGTFKSSGGASGITDCVNFIDDDGRAHTIEIEDGLITGWAIQS